MWMILLAVAAVAAAECARDGVEIVEKKRLCK